MTEQVAPRGHDEPRPESESRVADLESTASAGTTRTGVPVVDQVLTDVDRLDERPLDEHLAAFERAHEALHAALDAEPAEQAEQAEPGEPGEPGEPA